MITGIPPYISPPFQSLRCTCGVRYVVLVGDGVNEQAARRDALRLGADFIDARRLLGFSCYRGEMIDVSLESTYKVQ